MGWDVASLRADHAACLSDIGRAMDGAVKAILGSAQTIARDTKVLKVRTGAMRAGWKYGHSKTPGGAKGSLWNNVPHATYQERGTGVFGPKRAPYWIYPNKAKALRFVAANGSIVFASRVLHYGVHPRYMGRAAMYGREAMFFGEDHARNINLINRWLNNATKR